MSEKTLNKVLFDSTRNKIPWIKAQMDSDRTFKATYKKGSQLLVERSTEEIEHEPPYEFYKLIILNSGGDRMMEFDSRDRGIWETLYELWNSARDVALDVSGFEDSLFTDEKE